MPGVDDWWNRAACQGMGLYLFYGPSYDDRNREKPTDRTLREMDAIAVCRRCPVVSACLADELRRPRGSQFGVAGAMTAADRQALIDRRENSGDSVGKRSAPSKADWDGRRLRAAIALLA